MSISKTIILDRKSASTSYKSLIESVSSYLSNTNSINQNDWWRVPKSIMEHNNLEWLLQKIIVFSLLGNKETTAL